MNNCKICQNQETYNLPVCNHPFCRNCSNRHIFNKVVNHNNLDFLQCPICNTYVQIEKIQKYIDEKDYQLINDLIDDRNKTFGLGIDDALIKCFMCNDIFSVNKGLQIVKCFNCKQEICKNCNRDVHKSLTCAQHIQQKLQLKENSIQKPLLEEQIKQQKQEEKQENKKQEQKQEQNQEKLYEQVPINYQSNIYQQNQQQIVYYPIQQQQSNYQVYQQNHNIIYISQDDHRMRQQYSQIVVNQQQILQQPEIKDEAKQFIKGNSQEKNQFQKETQDEEKEKDPGTPKFTQKDKKIQIQQEIMIEIPLNVKHEICIICFDPVGGKNNYNLDIKLPICGHPFCRTCLNEYLSNMVIKPKLLDQLMCPYCRTKLMIESVQQHLDKQIFDQISELIIQSGQINGLGVDDAWVKCFKCDVSFLLNKGLLVAECPYCQIEICRKCNKNSHQDISCEEFAKINIDEESLKFQQYAQQQGWIKCPKCNQTIERIKGCNFMRCESSECKRRTYFCFLCRQSLTRDDHYKHFYKNNPYLNECQVTLKKQKEFLKTAAAPEKSQEQIKQQQIEKPQQVQQMQPANQIKYENNFRFTIETPNVQNQNIQYQYVQAQPQNLNPHQPEQIKIVNNNQQPQIQQFQYGNNQQYATVTQSVQIQNIQLQPAQIQFVQPQYAQKQNLENQEIKIGTQPENTHYQVLQQQVQQPIKNFSVVYQQVDVRQHQSTIQYQNFGLQQNNQYKNQQMNQEKVNPEEQYIHLQNNQQLALQINDQQNNQGQEILEKPKIVIKKIPIVRNIPQNLRSDPSFGPPETEYNQILVQILTQTCRNCANELEVFQSNIRQCQVCENRYCNKCFCQIFSDHVC